MTIEKKLRQAEKEIRAERWQAAAALYGQILAERPAHATTLHQLGLLAQRAGRGPEALHFFWDAIAANPREAKYHNDLGTVLGSLGRAEEAERAFRKAIELRAGYAEAHSNLGIALKMRNRFEEAIAAFQESLRWQPHSSVAHFNLGNLYRVRQQYDEAIASYGKATELQPRYVEAHNNLSIVLANAGRMVEARAACERALEIDPACAEALLNLGNYLSDEGRLEEAVEKYACAARLRPDYAEAQYNIALNLKALGRIDEADAVYTVALQQQPEEPYARFRYACLLLTNGNLKEGWPLYEARWTANALKFPPWEIHQPLYDGRTLQGERVLVHVEQGAGDTIQFVRYLAMIRARGGLPVVCAPRPLIPLLRCAEGVAEIVTHGEPIPNFQYHIAMMSLPLVFGTTVETIPAPVPYFRVPPARLQYWRERLSAWDGRPKVGLVWAGNPNYRKDRQRSMTLTTLRPLLEVGGVQFFSLQKGRGAEDLQDLKGEMPMIDLTDELTDYVETAALIAQLDLVISVDTSVAHLTGALGKPVWTMLATLPDWRWLLERCDSPWYPSMRLFRQTKYMEWDSVVAQLAAELRKVASTLPA